MTDIVLIITEISLSNDNTMIEYSDGNRPLDLVTKMKLSLLQMFYSLFRAAEKEPKRLKKKLYNYIERSGNIFQLILYEFSYV